MELKHLKTLCNYADTERLGVHGWTANPLVSQMNPSELQALRSLLEPLRPNIYWLVTRWPEGAEL